jgi:biotin carboxyl carrier protein
MSQTQRRPASEPADDPGLYLQGEFLSIAEVLVVSPARGRLHPEPIEEGRRVPEGAVLGHINGWREPVPVIALAGGIFQAWLVAEGEPVVQGMLLARLRKVEGGGEAPKDGH